MLKYLKTILIITLVYGIGITNAQQSKSKENGFVTLFDGTNMDSWEGNTKEYVLEDSCIVMKPTQEMGGNLYSKEEYADFILRFDFQLTPGANNGLGIRHDMVANKEGYSGMELQILDNENPQYKDLKPYQYHGSVYGISPAKRGFLKEPGEWNSQEVIAKGDQIIVRLNGQVILKTNLKEAVKKLPADSYAKAVMNKNGHIAFLGHGTTVKFKHIRVKRL
ncbi:MAG: 3-keto-disaccharide hydrolase [Sphingobacterium sp.]